MYEDIIGFGILGSLLIVVPAAIYGVFYLYILQPAKMRHERGVAVAGELGWKPVPTQGPKSWKTQYWFQSELESESEPSREVAFACVGVSRHRHQTSVNARNEMHDHVRMVVELTETPHWLKGRPSFSSAPEAIRQDVQQLEQNGTVTTTIMRRSEVDPRLVPRDVLSRAEHFVLHEFKDPGDRVAIMVQERLQLLLQIAGKVESSGVVAN